jgi:hypothetical protein
MHWEILIIPLIALGVWILGTLFKGAENDPVKRGVRRPSSSSGRAPARRPVTDLDRFLEEARRRREAEERRKVPAPPPRPATTRVPLSERPSRNLDVPSRPVPTARRAEEVPAVIPVAQPSSAREAAPEAALVVPRAKRVVEASPPPPSAPVTTRDTRPSPILQQVRSLLSKPQTAGAAFVLREILDRPRCQRRR